MATSPAGSRLWVTLAVRAGFAIAAALVVTFSANHSTWFGASAFGTWATVTGVVVGALVARSEREEPEASGVRILTWVWAVATAAAGVVALSTSPDPLLFNLVVAIWAAVTAVVELFAALWGATARRNDRLTTALFTAALAALFVLVRLDAVSALGFLGAYWAIIGVYLAIAAFSARWPAPVAAELIAGASTADPIDEAPTAPGASATAAPNEGAAAPTPNPSTTEQQ
ncbi:MAG TPA: hypothetical protein VFU07_10600 [Candidatus Lumbricidophila sp.]|nr:hypothetical protein [Candidatus Lumbricidophila sp.]